MATFLSQELVFGHNRVQRCDMVQHCRVVLLLEKLCHTRNSFAIGKLLKKIPYYCSLLSNGYQGLFSGGEAEHSPPSSDEVK